MGVDEEIDYVLVHTVTAGNKTRHEQREIFESNLRGTGLIVETLYEVHNKQFSKIFAPMEVLLRYSEIMKLKMPLKQLHQDQEHGQKALIEQYSRNKHYLFDVDSEDFMPPSLRYIILHYILENEKYTPDLPNIKQKFGISKLIYNGTYVTAYPLHEESMRRTLKHNWASVNGMCVRQPLHHVKDYFGNKIALYFVWLEFYTFKFLIPSSALGLLYSLLCACIVNNELAEEMCEQTPSIYVMCAECDKECEFWNVIERCSYGTIAMYLGNYISVGYGIIMAMGNTVFMKMWNRYNAQLVYSWGVTEYDLLDFEMPTIYKKEGEGGRRSIPFIILSVTVVLCWVGIVVAVLLALTIYRISLQTSEFMMGEGLGSEKSLFIGLTGSVLDLVSIIILNNIYECTAVWLTENENCRTQKEYEESLMWKLYIFWFINYYSTLFYIAFFKGRFVGTPDRYNRVFGFRQEECGPEGCVVDLAIQIAVILIGDMTYSNFIEHVMPFITTLVKKRRKRIIMSAETNERRRQCYTDYKLLDISFTYIGYEHLEMVLQYGMVSLFCIAFPFGPLFALLNNLFELRLDAKKLLMNFKRPVARNVHDIGIWLTIMELTTQLSVITNACCLAFTTNLIPYFVYGHIEQFERGSSFLDFYLTKFDLSELDKKVKTRPKRNITDCYFTGFYNPSGHKKEYKLSEMYWCILALRLLFVIVYQNIIVLLRVLIHWLLPDIPQSLKDRMITDQKKTQNHIIREENLRRKGKLF